MRRIAVFGGVYSNHLALRAFIEETTRLGILERYCLGDLGAFGPNPDKVFPLLLDAGISVMQGNYDHSIGNGLTDCQCGYTDPMDNYYARLSYQYTYRKTSPKNRAWMRDLPKEFRLTLGGKKVLFCHGSPRQMNEFLWETGTSDTFLQRLAREFDAEIVVGTHTGLYWERKVAGLHFINCGVIGRPANDGTTHVWWTLLEETGDGVRAEFRPLVYDYQQLAEEMRGENLPAPFVETVETGWWTTCLEILPMKERTKGRY